MSMAASLFAGGLWLVAVVHPVIALARGPSELSVVATASSIGLPASVLLGGRRSGPAAASAGCCMPVR
jgi:hypothetical protein